MTLKKIKITFLLTLFLTAPSFGYAQEEAQESEQTPPLTDIQLEDTDLQNPSLNDPNFAPSNSSTARGASSSGGGGSDIGTPANSPFDLGSDISGTIQNSINQVTGKIAFSVPLASIASGTVSYGLSIGYDGQSAFKIGKEQNKYNPTSVVGVGWSLPISKIVVDNKQTGTWDDDEFYIVGGATNSKLICTKRGTNSNGNVWEFQLEKHTNWKITYHPGYNDTMIDNSGNVVIVYIKTDYWSVIKDDGQTYIFGYSDIDTSNTSQSKEFVASWGNWIGDSNKTPTGVSTIVWNLSRITDQWNNSINFKYELVEQKQNTSPSASSFKHTEASYLKEITSSKGSKIQLNYASKNVEEYYEPHREKSEPDAYQERYEKKYLQGVDVYNTKNQRISSYNLGSSLSTSSNGNQKRYLGSITQSSHLGGETNALPPQLFEYHTSGTYKGGLKKISYPSGGSVTYNYQNKTTFYNGEDRFKTTPVWPSGYSFYSALVKDNYSLSVLRTISPVSNGKHRFKIFRYWWNGQQWESHEFTFPHLIEDSSSEFMKNFYSVLGTDFYGFAYDRGSTADVYLFHKEKNGNTWNYFKHSGLNIGSDNPLRFLSGTKFVGLGSHKTGKLYTYVWNGRGWNSKQLNQGSGQYFYGATNNFILSLDEEGGSDMVTGANHSDNYYVHYLDAENRWQTKSWSAAADPYINDIWISESRPGLASLYPANSIAGLVAKDNPELFLRWDINYNLTAVDNVLGWYNDKNSIIPVNNSMFTVVWHWFNQPAKAARFNGVNWKVSPFSTSTDFYHVNFGLDLMTYKNEDSDNIMYKEYSANSHSWVENNLNWAAYAPYASNAVNSEFIVAGKKIYKKTFQAPPVLPVLNIGTLQYDNDFSYSDGLSHTFVKQYNSNNEFKKSSYYYINKETGFLSEINLGSKYHLAGREKIGGHTPFMSPKAIWLRSNTTYNSDTETYTFNTFLYRIIDDKFNQSVYDIVVGSIDLDSDDGAIRKVNYTYNNPHPSPDNNATYYGEVIVENKGFGTSSIGKIKKLFHTGAEDVQLLGLPLEEQVLDTNNNLKSKTTNSWEKQLKTIYNTSSQAVGLSHYINLKSKKEEVFFDNYTVENLTTYSYTTKGQLASTYSTNSTGQTERQDIRYAHEQYPFMSAKNRLTDAYETTTKLNNAVVDLKRNIWVHVGGKVYVKEKWSGPSLSLLRLNNQVTNVDLQGNLLEINNGKNIFSSSLRAYTDLYEVASIVNAKHQDVVNALDVSYAQLQTLNTPGLKAELMKLYTRLPEAMISLTFYDDNGRVVNKVNERKEESFVYYDNFGRVDYITDGYGKVIEKKEYNFGN